MLSYRGKDGGCGPSCTDGAVTAHLFSKQDSKTGMGRIPRDWLASLDSHQEKTCFKDRRVYYSPRGQLGIGALPGIAAVTAPFEKGSVRSRRAKVVDTGGIAPHPARGGTIRFRNGSHHY